MRRRGSLAVAAFLLLFPLAGLLPAQDGLPDGQPDVNGVWAGKMRVAESPLTTGGKASRSAPPATLDLVHAGPDLLAVLALGEGPEPLMVNLQGKVGNGSFWIAGDLGPSSPVVLSGKVAGSGKALKGTGTLVLPDRVQALKFSLKRSAAPE